ESPTQVTPSRQPGSECCVSRRRRRPRSVHSGCVGCVIESRNGSSQERRPCSRSNATRTWPLRAGTKGDANQQHTGRTQSRGAVSQVLARIRQTARERKKERFTALFHHINVELLRDAFFAIKREAAPGVDGLTWEAYATNREANLLDL